MFTLPGWQAPPKWYAETARRSTALSLTPRIMTTTPAVPLAARGKTVRRPSGRATPSELTTDTTLTPLGEYLLAEQDDTAFLAWLESTLDAGREAPDAGPEAK